MLRLLFDRHVFLLVGSLLLLLLTAGQCGAAVDSGPVPNAGADQTVRVGDAVRLDGSASSDPDGDALTFGWSFQSVPAGSDALIAGMDTGTPSFTADMAGVYVVTLTVSDGSRQASDTVHVTSSTAGNAAPVIATIEDQAMFSGDTIDVPFTFTDENPDSATVEGTSGDQLAIADANIQVLGSGGERVLRVDHSGYRAGIVTITASVRDSEGLEAAESFQLDVAPKQYELFARDPADSDRFGVSVAIDGDYAVVGAHQADVNGMDTGAAYVFRRGEQDWVPHGKLPPAGLVAASVSAGDQFGISVAISGDYVIVGAPGDDDGGSGSGAAYAYERCDSTFAFCDQPWHEMGKLTAFDAVAGANFGRAVAVSGEYAVVGAYTDDAPGSDDVGGSNTNEGSAYVFKRSGDRWVEIDKLTASDAAEYDQFGRSVAVSGDYIVVGAFGDDLTGEDEGAAYVFKRAGEDWVETGKLTAADAADGDNFGVSVGVDADVAIVGAFLDNRGGVDQGAAYIFQRSGEDWTEMDKLTAPVPQHDVLFGVSVGVSGKFAVVGAIFENHTDDFFKTDEGAAYLFERSGDDWLEVERLTTRYPADSDHFGSSVAIRDGFVVVGAPGVDLQRCYCPSETEEGAAYVFERWADE